MQFLMIGLRLKAVRSNMLVLFIVKEVLYIPMIAVRKKTHSFCYSSPRILYKNSNYYLSSMYVEWQYGQVYMLIEKCWVW